MGTILVGRAMAPAATALTGLSGLATSGSPDVPLVENLLVNGGLEIWQRGTGPFSGNNTYSADRWQAQLGGSDTLSTSRDGANADAGSEFCAACTFTVTTGSGLYQRVEGYVALRGRTLTFSCRVRTSVAAAVRLELHDGVAGTNSAYHTGDGTYQTLSVTRTIAGTASMVRVGVQAMATATVYVDSATLCVGAGVLYLPRTAADDMARCKRYYHAIGGDAPFEYFGVGLCTATNTVSGIVIPYPAEMPIVPTVAFTAAATFAVLSATGNVIGLTAITSNSPGRRSTAVVATIGAASLVAGNSSPLLANNSTAARLTLEANP